MVAKREITDMTDVRQILIDTIKGVRDGQIKIEQAKMINDLGQTLVNSARVEVEFMRLAGTHSGFLAPVDDTITPHEEVGPDGKPKQLMDRK